METVTKLIVETFENEQPKLCLAIKQAIEAGESRVNFIAFMKQVFGSSWQTSITYSASLTVFDYYKAKKQLEHGDEPNNFRGSEGIC